MKRIVAILLVMAMLFSFAATTVSAVDAEASEPADQTEEITL